MRKLELFLLYSLICFSLQDQYCVQTIDLCVVDFEEEEEKDPSQPSTITNCLYDYEYGGCGECNEGYALSYDSKRCVLFENCDRLENGNDEKCESCIKLYQPNSEGKCDKTFCAYHEKDVCKSCVKGYYLKENTGKKITIPTCIKWDEKVCTKCDDFAKLDGNGKCILQNLINGCIEYHDGKCASCGDAYKSINGGVSCQYEGCPNGKIVQYCFICQTGFEQDDDGKCIGYDGTKDTSLSNFNKIQPVMLMLIVALLI